MLNKNFFSKSSSIARNKIIIIISLLMIILGVLCGEAYKYNRLIDDFKRNFDSYNFSEANNIVLTKENFNIFKLFMLKNDLTSYLNSCADTISNDINNNSIYSSAALYKLKEINHYNLVSLDKISNIESSIDSIKNSNENYINGMAFLSNNQYDDAILSFKIVSPLDLNYANSIKYLTTAKDKLKDDIINQCNDLVSKDYYTQALNIISTNKDILGANDEIQEKIADIKVKQQQYIDKNSEAIEAASKALTTSITPSNINSLNIESSTSYLINVNIKEQKTYVYKGKVNKWNLIKTFACSTGIDTEPTPTGSFSIKEKGDWFFSNKYNQGGKYWCQITGDILFHSLPFAMDKTTVLDYTLKKPSSHGCIRLATENAKWIYTNVPKDSKVIIK